MFTPRNVMFALLSLTCAVAGAQQAAQSTPAQSVQAVDANGKPCTPSDRLKKEIQIAHTASDTATTVSDVQSAKTDIQEARIESHLGIRALPGVMGNLASAAEVRKLNNPFHHRTDTSTADAATAPPPCPSDGSIHSPLGGESAATKTNLVDQGDGIHYRLTLPGQSQGVIVTKDPAIKDAYVDAKGAKYLILVDGSAPAVAKNGSEIQH